MLFGTIRIILGFFIFAAFLFIVKVSKTNRKRRFYMISLVLAILCSTLSFLFPFENAFVTFSTPESAFSYTNSGDIKLIIDGSKTNFVVAEEGDISIYSIIPKTEKGWKLGVGFDTKNLIQKVWNGVVIYVYQYKNIDDYYITVLNTNGGPLEIADNCNSKFFYLSKSDEYLNETFYTYCAYIQKMDNQYSLTVNGQSFSLTNE